MNSTVENVVDTTVSADNEIVGFSISYTNLALILGAIVLYIIYYCKFREAEFLINPKYDIKKKKMGKPLPPYPNGWYVACHSKDLKTG